MNSNIEIETKQKRSDNYLKIKFDNQQTFLFPYNESYESELYSIGGFKKKIYYIR
jgi:hypothetical protein